MILYFSGTGNSAHAAKYIGKETGDSVINLFNRIRSNDYSPVDSEKPWVIVAPVYCWQLPRLVRDWMLQTEFVGSKDIYFVLTCGSSMGNADKHLKQLCEEKGLNYRGVSAVVMPENYIAMFEAPEEDEEAVIMKKADRILARIARRIKNDEDLSPAKVSIIGKILTMINPVYYKLIVKDKKFYAAATCNSCGLCEKKCPLGNITMVNGKPEWSGNCTHCMACIAYCPTEAIEYGNISKGKRRYTCGE